MSAEKGQSLTRREFLRFVSLATLGGLIAAFGDGPVQTRSEVGKDKADPIPETNGKNPIQAKIGTVVKEEPEKPRHCYVVTGMDPETCTGGSTVAIYPTEEVIVFQDGTKVGPFDRDRCGLCVPAGDNKTR